MIYKIYTPSKSGKNKCPGINILLNASWWGVVGVEATTSGTSLGLGECFHLATRMLLLGLWCVFLEGVGLITETGGAWVSESLNSVAPSPGYPNDWYRRGGARSWDWGWPVVSRVHWGEGWLISPNYMCVWFPRRTSRKLRRENNLEFPPPNRPSQIELLSVGLRRK